MNSNERSLHMKDGNKFLKKLFLVDGVGALVSAVLLGVVLVQFETYFGIPESTLYFLAALPCLFAIYDFYCFYSVKKDLGKHLKRIAVANILYCCLSIGMAIYHSSEIEQLGRAYIIVEVLIVVSLALFELKSANRELN